MKERSPLNVSFVMQAFKNIQNQYVNTMVPEEKMPFKCNICDNSFLNHCNKFIKVVRNKSNIRKFIVSKLA